jgi:hypothetical protein
MDRILSESRKLVLLPFYLICFFNLSSLAQEKSDDTPNNKRTHTIGEITFKHADNFTLNKPNVERQDTITLFDNRYPDLDGFVFVSSPITLKSKGVDKVFRDKLRDDLAKAWVKNTAAPFKWKNGEQMNRISKYQIESKSYLGWNGEAYLFIDIRTVKYKKQNFLIGILKVQGYGKASQESFNDGLLEFIPIGLELTIAKITSSITNEPEPMMWPPEGIKGVPGGFVPPKEPPPSARKRN